MLYQLMENFPGYVIHVLIVPQGSVLVPLLFLIFINDLLLVLSEKVHSIDLYADDTTIYDMQSDLETLQSNLQHSLFKLHKWTKQNGMLLNAEKKKNPKKQKKKTKKTHTHNRNNVNYY